MRFEKVPRFVSAHVEVSEQACACKVFKDVVMMVSLIGNPMALTMCMTCTQAEPEREAFGIHQQGKRHVHIELVVHSAQLGVRGQVGLDSSQDVHLRKVEGETKVIGIQPESFPIVGVNEPICAEHQRNLHVLWTHCSSLHYLLAKSLTPLMARSGASAEIELS